MRLIKKAFKELTALDLQRACTSRNPEGKYVNIYFGFYTIEKAFTMSVIYNKRLGVFTARILWDKSGLGAEYKLFKSACFFSFQKAYEWLSDWQIDNFEPNP